MLWIMNEKSIPYDPKIYFLNVNYNFVKNSFEFSVMIQIYVTILQN